MTRGTPTRAQAGAGRRDGAGGGAAPPDAQRGAQGAEGGSVAEVRQAGVLVVSVPLPDRLLCGNGALPASRGLKIARGRMVKEQRTIAYEAAQRARFEANRAIIQVGRWFTPPLRVRVDVLVRRDPIWAARRLDDDNMIRGLKATMDGLTDAGIWGDDRQVVWGVITWEKASPLAGGVELTLTQQEG